MNVLAVCPLPPPTNGMSLAAKIVVERIEDGHSVKVVNLSKTKRPNSFRDHIERSFEVMNFLRQVAMRKSGANMIYFTISESVAGNIKDLFIYLLCFRKLDNMFIHMLGGEGMRSLVEGHPLLAKINRFFIQRVRGIVVEGDTQAKIFSYFSDSEKIHVVRNFAEDFLFVNDDQVRAKFENVQQIRILFLSNLILGKGYEELVDAYLMLDSKAKQRLQITFVGGFQSPAHETAFHNKIKNESGIVYHGKFAGGEEKKALYLSHHVFCLPTYYRFEGQPISLLEAYATGCVVITTLHSGIPEVFVNEKNGYAVEKKSAASICGALIRLTDRDPATLLKFAMNNVEEARSKYRISIYRDSMAKILGLDNSEK